MLASLVFTALLANPAQVIDGRKPVLDGTIPFAKALGKNAAENPTIMLKPDMFAAGYFAMRAKSLLPLLNTKYTAAHVGICGTMLGLYDTELGKMIKEASDRITKGTKDFDSFTKSEQDAIGNAVANEKSPIYPFNKDKTMLWEYFAGAHLGSLSAYTTYWHVSPKQTVLLEGIVASVQSCVAQGAKPEGSARKDLADALREFSQFQGSNLEEPAMRRIATQIEAALKAATPVKYRW